MQTYIFVYGTLIVDLDSGPGRLLAQQAEMIGKGRIKGILYDLGNYPGLVYQAESKQTVVGQIFQLHHAKQTLSILDAYEGYDPAFPNLGEYIRRCCPVTHENGNIFYCDVYIYQGENSNKTQITSGDYRSFLKQNQSHQDFIDTTKST